MRVFDSRGTWSRTNTKDTVDDCLRLDAQAVATKLDLTQRGYASWRWSWSRLGGERTSTIDFWILPGEGIRLNYNCAGVPVPPYLAPVVTTVPNYGGLRYWFLCPRCNRRIRYLYCDRLFLCRSCHGLTYRTTQATKTDLHNTLTNQMDRIRRQLRATGGPLDPCPDKPRYMHADIYFRLWFQYTTIQRLYLAAWMGRLARYDDDLADSDPGFPRQAWLEYKRAGRPPGFRLLAALTRGASAEWAADAERLLREVERTDPHRRLTLGELATAALVPYAFAKEAQAEGLIRPDGGRGTRTHRYRRRLAAWLGKLHAARAAGLSWAELLAWSRRRWLPGHEHERQAPAELSSEFRR